MTTAPPSSQQRRQCWAQRDAYFTCLNKNNLWLNGLEITGGHDAIVALDTTKPLAIKFENDKSLSKEEKERLFVCKEDASKFEKECLASWVFHFSMLRVKELQTKHLVEHQKQKEDALRDKKGSDAFWDKVKQKASS